MNTTLPLLTACACAVISIASCMEDPASNPAAAETDAPAAGNAPPAGKKLQIRPRASWDKSGVTPSGLKEHTRGITNIVIHHTGAPNPDLEPAEKAPARIASIYKYHTEQRSPVWKDIAYHYFIATDGTIYAGRDEKFQTDSGAPYPLDGALTVTIMGDYSRQLPPDAVLDSLVALVRDRQAVHKTGKHAVTTHKGAGGATSCPGPLIQKWFDTTGKGRISA